MNLDFSLTIVTEGRTKLIVPADHTTSGPSSSKMPAFFNPQMEFSRDFSVALLSSILKDGDSFLDGLAAIGSRGIRIAKECDKKIMVHLNDFNKKSVELINRNIDLNGIDNATVSEADLRKLLLENTYDCLDIDPFGTPVGFFPMAVSAVRNDGILCVTATDTGSISGIFSRACLRKYGCRAKRTPFAHEIGVRNLIGFIAREAAKMDMGIDPIASFYADHYVRTFVRLKRGAKESDRTLYNLGYCQHDADTLERAYVKEAEADAIGPIWIEKTSDPEILRGIQLPRDLRTVNRIIRMRDSIIREAEINRPFFRVDEFARMLKTNPPGMDDLLKRLNETGISIRTHYDAKSFSTNLTMDEIIKAFF